MGWIVLWIRIRYVLYVDVDVWIRGGVRLIDVWIDVVWWWMRLMGVGGVPRATVGMEKQRQLFSAAAG